MDRYDWPEMGPEHPIDHEVRARLLKLFESGAVTEAEFARRTSTKQPWLHRYARGEGHATIDEVIRLAAAAAGVQTVPLSGDEGELVRLWRGLGGEDDRDDVLAYLRMRVRRRQQKESSAPAARTLPGKVRTTRGKPKAAEG